MAMEIPEQGTPLITSQYMREETADVKCCWGCLWNFMTITGTSI
jgi:hypothetical protein